MPEDFLRKQEESDWKVTLLLFVLCVGYLIGD